MKFYEIGKDGILLGQASTGGDLLVIEFVYLITFHHKSYERVLIHCKTLLL